MSEKEAVQAMSRRLLIALVQQSHKYNARTRFKLDVVCQCIQFVAQLTCLAIRKALLFIYSACAMFIVCKIQINTMNTQMFLKVCNQQVLINQNQNIAKAEQQELLCSFFENQFMKQIYVNIMDTIDKYCNM